MFDAAALGQLHDAHGPFVRVVVAAVRGSTPREVGAEMAVWAEGSAGTIGGGALEHEAIRMARARSAPGAARFALGPALGQCCGGAVTLLFEPVTEPPKAPDVQLRALRIDGPDTPPLWLARARSAARRGEPVPTRLAEGWFCEPVAAQKRALWVWGAGHVGREVVALMAGLPGWQITWIDTAESRFPDAIPPGVELRIAPDPAALVPAAPIAAHHLIFTFSHALDLALCHGLLAHGFASAGLIGSATKWARFRNRLAALGHAPPAIARITCPIGDPALGKHPRAIAIGVAARLMAPAPATTAARSRA